MAKFYEKDQDDFAPRYGDIDWRAVLLAKLAVEGITAPTGAIWFDSGDGIDQQCTQETVTIYLSKASDDMDVVLVHDPRDNTSWSFFRNDLGTEVFDQTSRSLQEVGAAIVVYSLFPRREIVDSWVKQNIADDVSGFIPDDWMEI